MKTALLSSLSVFLCLSSAADPSWPVPTKEMKPWVYNWWMGSAVDEAGLEYQSEQLEKMGFGGFHVIPIYGAKGYEKQWKKFLSPEWTDAFTLAVKTAGKHGLGVDMTTGSGWCFGGPQLSADEGAWLLQVTKDRSSFKPEGDPKAPVVLWEGKNAKGESVILSTRKTCQAVKRAGLGGQGPMMDPFSRKAIGDLLKPFTDAFAREGVAKPEHMYHDSYEYYGAAWSPEFLEAFKAKRGYDLRDHLAELAGVGDADDIARIKCDYRETLSDVMIEDVFPVWIDWCRRRGISTRNEAHGAPCNLLDFYGLADIPETEMFGEKDRNVLVSKFASSAAHVKGTRYVASESCTWIKEHYTEKLSDIKVFMDDLFLSGVNHAYYHGFCYSPKDAVWPGWCFYASLEMNPRNPIWRHVDAMNAYITRVQGITQTARCDNDLLVYWPIYDYWTDPNGFEKQLAVHAVDWLEGQPIGNVAKRLYDEGYAFDYISDRQLMSLRPDAGSYTTILVPDAKYMPLKTMKRLSELSISGYDVVFAGDFPKSVPGFKSLDVQNRILGRFIETSKFKRGPLEEVLKNARLAKEPFAKANGLAYTRHVDGKSVYYFIVNRTDGKISESLKPARSSGDAWLMDPMTGSIAPADVTADGKVRIELESRASVILRVTLDSMQMNAVAKRVAREYGQLKVTGDWRVEPAEELGNAPKAKARKMSALKTWSRNDDGSENPFVGTMRYTASFEAKGNESQIDLGDVRWSAKVKINGTDCGTVIMPPYRIDLPNGVLKRGANAIEIEVAGTGANGIRWNDRNKVNWKYFYDTNMVNRDYRKFDASKWPLAEEGLIGPVSIR